MWERRRGSLLEASDQKGLQPIGHINNFNDLKRERVGYQVGSLRWFGGVELAAQGHNILKIALLALVALHVVGAVYHHFVLKDGLINRMRRAES